MAALRFVRLVRAISLIFVQYLILTQVLRSFQAESGLEPRYSSNSCCPSTEPVTGGYLSLYSNEFQNIVSVMEGFILHDA